MDFGQSVILEREKDAESDADVDNLSVAHQSASAGETEKLIRAIQVDPTLLEQQDGDGLTPLGHAILGRRLSAVKKLVKIGANVNAQDNLGRTSLVIAAYQGWYEGVVYLLRHGAKFNLCDKSGRTALHASTYDSDYRTMCALLHNIYPSDLNRRDQEGMTALHWGAFHNRPDHVRILLERGADIFREDVDGKTALHWAAQKGNIKCCELLYKWKDGVLLLNHTDHAGKSPVHFAAAAGNVEVIQEFAEVADCDLEAEDPDDRTPLHWAVATGQSSCVSLLLDLGVTPNSVDAEGCTPLDYAKQSQNIECQKLLEYKLGIISGNLSGGKNVIPQFSLSLTSPSKNTSPFSFFKSLFGMSSKKKRGLEDSSDISNADMKSVDMALMKEEYLSCRGQGENCNVLSVPNSNRAGKQREVSQSEIEKEFTDTLDVSDVSQHMDESKQSEGSNETRESVLPSDYENNTQEAEGDANRLDNLERTTPPNSRSVSPLQKTDRTFPINVLRDNPDWESSDDVHADVSLDIKENKLQLFSPRKSLSLPVEGEKHMLAKLPATMVTSSPQAQLSVKKVHSLQPMNASPRRDPVNLVHNSRSTHRQIFEHSELAPLKGPKPPTGKSVHEKVIALRMERTGASRSPTPPSWVDRPFDPLTPRHHPGRSPLAGGDNIPEKLTMLSAAREILPHGNKNGHKVHVENKQLSKLNDRSGTLLSRRGDKSVTPPRLHSPQLSPPNAPSPQNQSSSEQTLKMTAGTFSRQERKQLDKQLHNLLL